MEHTHARFPAMSNHFCGTPLGPIRTGRGTQCAPANSNIFPLMLLGCSVDTPIHINRSLCLRHIAHCIPRPVWIAPHARPHSAHKVQCSICRGSTNNGNHCCQLGCSHTVQQEQQQHCANNGEISIFAVLRCYALLWAGVRSSGTSHNEKRPCLAGRSGRAWTATRRW